MGQDDTHATAGLEARQHMLSKGKVSIPRGGMP